MRRLAILACAAVAIVACAALALAAAAPDDPLVERQWHLPHIGTFAAWDAAGRGDGVVVAVVDSGVDSRHPDLRGQLTRGIDLVDRGTSPDDPNGHGTLVAGIIAMVAGNGVGGAGVAPDTRIMPVRVLDASGRGDSRTVAEGIRWAADQGAAVINLSLADAPGQTRDLAGLITTDVELAIREASLKGALVVAAAGNEGRTAVPYRPQTPVLVVGASGRDDGVWPHSNRDSRTLFAPGVEMITTYPAQRYMKADGTSFATPVVAGAAAVLRAQGLDAARTRQRLEQTAVEIGTGVGRVDLAAAVGAQAAAPSSPAAQSPAPRPATPPPADAPPPAPPAPVEEGDPPPAAPHDDPAPAPPPEPVDPEEERPLVAGEPGEPGETDEAAPVPDEAPAAAPQQAEPPSAPLPTWLVWLAVSLVALNTVGLVAAAGRRR